MAIEILGSDPPQPLSLSRAGQTHTWVAGFADRLLITDLCCVIGAVAFAQMVRFAPAGSAPPAPGGWGTDIDATLVSMVIAVAWIASLSVFDSRDARVLGTGTAEYGRIIQATLATFGFIAIASYATQFDLARGYVAIALPIGLALLLIGRYAWRGWLAERRSHGFFLNKVVIVGSIASVTHIVDQLRQNPTAGLRVLGVCVPAGTEGQRLLGTDVPVLGDIDGAIEAMAAVDAETLILTGADALGPRRIRELTWRLEPSRQHLIVAPELTDAGGPRIRPQPVAGLSLFHVETPSFSRSKRFVKRVFDLLFSLVLGLLLIVPMLVVAMAIKLDSKGPVLFRQERVGFRGTTFVMLKFRSMCVDAEQSLASILAERDDGVGNGVLFKMKDDPRVTRVGRLLRRYSIDELPQLANVFLGHMSHVGPRPPLPKEVDVYEEFVHRKFLVKPGMTGLWQVSGRSNLSWEESVRLDLYYVEHCSLTDDLQILWRTAKAVVGRDGAY